MANTASTAASTSDSDAERLPAPSPPGAGVVTCTIGSATTTAGAAAMVGVRPRPLLVKAAVRLATDRLSEAASAVAAAAEAVAISVSTLRFAARSRRRRTSTSVTPLMSTSVSETPLPAAAATPVRNCRRRSSVNSATVASGRLTESATLFSASLHSCGNESHPSNIAICSHSATDAVRSAQHSPEAKQSDIASAIPATAAQSGFSTDSITSCTHVCVAAGQELLKHGALTGPSPPSSLLQVVVHALAAGHVQSSTLPPISLTMAFQ
mmetsp:Transcript_21939/g.44621  ORF Transcript_21939/g.44621 Transcript_21939/m.44621 type:complete len:267 (+) Transcript_21939:120-920(+)